MAPFLTFGRRGASIVPQTLLLTVLGVAGCTTSAAEVAETDVARPAKLVEALSLARAHNTLLPGDVRAADEVELSFRVSGPLAHLDIEAGDEVDKGAVLARIDARDFRVQLGAARARRDAAQAQFGNTQTEERRTRNLVESNALPQAQLDSVEGAHRVATANLDGARQAVQAAKMALGDTKLRAPFAGRIAAVRVEQHQWINASAPVLLLRSEGRLEVGVDVPERRLQALLEAPEGALHVRFPALGDTLHPAHVVSHQTEVDPMTKTYEVSLALDEPVPGVSPGMTAEAEWSESAAGEGVVVPLAAVGTGDAGEPFVYQYIDGVLHAKSVTLGAASDAGVVVTAGLADGDVLLAAGVRAANEGQRVRPVSQEDIGG